VKRRISGTVGFWMVSMLVVLSCASPFLLPQPSQPSTSVPFSLNTIVAQTAGAAQTETIVALPSTATFTLTSSPTRTPTEPFTPSPTFLFEKTAPVFALDATASAWYATEDAELGENGKDIPTPQPWACKVISKLPADGATVARGERFYLPWLVQNIGTKTWPAQGVDVVFYTGGRFHEKHYYNIPFTVSPGGSVKVIVPLTAPKRIDSYSTTWALKVGKRAFCALKITFVAQ